MDRAPENQQSPPGPPPVNEAPLRLGWGAFWIALAAMAAGVVFIGWAVWAKDQWLREHLLGQAHQLGQTISASNLQKLTGQPGDIGRPEYRRLKSQLMAAQQINPLWQWVYLLGRNADGEFYFQLDSVAADTAEVSPPGQLYPEAPPQLRELYEQGLANTGGPARDRWGTWISALVPIKDPRTGKMISALGIDVPADRWLRLCARAAVIPALFWLALVLQGVVGVVLLRRRANAPPARQRRLRHLEPVLACTTGLLVTLLMIWLTCQHEERDRQLSFQQLSLLESSPVLDVAHDLRDLELSGFSALFECSEEVTADEFGRYAEHLALLSEVTWWGWVCQVPEQDRTAFEACAAQLTGQTDYHIWSPPPAETETVLRRQAQFFPLVHQWPPKAHPELLGCDLGSDLLRNKEFRRVMRNTLTAIVTPRPELVATNRTGILLARATGAQAGSCQHSGLLLANLDVGRWLQNSLNATPAHRRMTVLDLFELTTDAAPRWLGSTAKQSGLDPVTDWRDLPPLTTIRPLLAFGRAYAIVARPTPFFFRLHDSHVGWVAIFGAVVTASVAWGLGMLSYRRAILVRLVEEQTTKLNESAFHYARLARQSRTVTWRVDLAGLYVDISDMVEEVLGYHPDEIIGHLHFYSLCPPAERTKFRDRWLPILRNGEPIIDVVNPVLTRAGDIRWVVTNGVPLHDEKGELTGYWGTDTDITDRKLAEDERQKLAAENQAAAERYAALVWASNTGAWEYIPANGNVWCSREYFSLLGYTDDDAITHQQPINVETAWENFVHPEDRPAAKAYLANYIANPQGFYDLRFRMRRKDGSWAWIWSRGRLTGGTAQQPASLIGTHIDITENIRAVEALRSSEQKYRMLTESMRDVVWIADADTLRFLYVSPTVERVRGYTPEEVMAGTLVDSLPPEEAHERRSLLKKALARFRSGELTENDFFVVELSPRCKDGSRITVETVSRLWHNPSTGKVELHGVSRDITERKQAEQERERLMRAIEQTDESVVITDAAGMIVFVNPAFTRTTGYTREEVLGHTPSILASDVQPPEFFQNLWSVLAAGQTWTGRFVNRHKSGSIYTEQATISPVRDTTGRIVNYVAAARDITAQIRAENEKAALQAQLDHAQKLETLGRLAGGVAHDFNNMLQAILGYTELALEQTAAGQPIHSDLREIQKVATRSTTLIRQLQTFARKQPAALQALEVNPTLDNMLDMLRRLVGEGIQLQWHPGENVGWIHVDPSQLDQIIVNLCLNARDAVGPNGCITLATAVMEIVRDGPATPCDLPPGSYVLLTVRDNGAGMPPDVVEHVFEPFYTTKPVGQGSGLGLSTVYGIVKRHNGCIQVHSVVGQGSEFRILLPRLASGIPPTEATATEWVELQAPNHEIILVVEDEPAILRVTRSMLESLGYVVLTASSANEAAKLCRGKDCNIDLLLTDINLPPSNGIALSQEIKKRFPCARHLFMSGYPANLDGPDAIDPAHFLAKPFTRLQLAQKVRAVLLQDR